MKKIYFAIGLFCCLVLSACHKEKSLQEVDYLIFGYANSSWGHTCEFYKLTPESLFEPSSICGTDTLDFQTIPMSDAAFSLAETLIHSIPEELFYGEQTNFEGEPCADCGGYFVEINKAGEMRQFSFGEDKSKDWPSEVRAFYQDFKTVIALLPQ